MLVWRSGCWTVSICCHSRRCFYTLSSKLVVRGSDLGQYDEQPQYLESVRCATERTQFHRSLNPEHKLIPDTQIKFGVFIVSYKFIAEIEAQPNIVYTDGICFFFTRKPHTFSDSVVCRSWKTTVLHFRGSVGIATATFLIRVVQIMSHNAPVVLQRISYRLAIPFEAHWCPSTSFFHLSIQISIVKLFVLLNSNKPQVHLFPTFCHEVKRSFVERICQLWQVARKLALGLQIHWLLLHEHQMEAG